MKKQLLFITILLVNLLLSAQTAIGPGLNNPRGLIVIDDYAYYHDVNQIERINVNNPMTAEVVITNLNYSPYTLEASSNGFFIPNTGGNNIDRAIISGTNVNPSFNFIDGTGGAIGFAFTDALGDIYFTRNNTASSGQLRRLLSSPNSSSVVANLPGSHTDIIDVATIGSDFYFSSINGAVWHFNRNNPSAGFTQIVASSNNVITGIEVTQNYLYYVNASNNRVVRVNRADGTGAINLFINLNIVYIDIADNVVYGITSNQTNDRLYAFTDPQLPPPCAAPSNITATVSGSADALVSWDAVSNAISYDVAYVEAGQPVANATVINTTSTSQLITNLVAGQTYDIYVRTNCGSDISNYATPILFGIPGIVYVDIDATGNNDGSSWADAYTSLQNAISNAVIGDEIWVAEGKYIPTSSSYVINKRLTIYGGFEGTENQINERDYINNLSIFSGDLANNDNLNNFPFIATDPTRQDNALRIIDVMANDIILDGVSIRGAHTQNLIPFNAIAVDAQIENFTLRNSEIAYNFNTGINSGINMQPTVNATYIIDNNRIHSNQSNTGTGIYIFTNASITANISIKNNLFYENRIENNGSVFSGPAGWIRAFASGSIVNLELVNNTFAKNSFVNPSSQSTAPSVFGISQTNGIINSTIENNIFWINSNNSSNNSNVLSISRVSGSSSGSMSASTANITPLPITTSSGNVGQNIDPLFTNIVINDFTLQGTSPAVDSGNNGFAVGVDLLGNPRVANGTVDLGAIEFGSVLSNSDFKNDFEFSLYPNPVKSILNISSKFNTIKQVIIYSLLGEEIIKTSEKSIDVDDFEEGIYIIKITNDNNSSFIKKFIKD